MMIVHEVMNNLFCIQLTGFQQPFDEEKFFYTIIEFTPIAT